MSSIDCICPQPDCPWCVQFTVPVYPFALNHGLTRKTPEDALAACLWPPVEQEVSP